MLRRRTWREFSPAQRIGTIVLGAVQLALFGAAELDIRRRPSGEIRGRKWFWSVVALINFAGPIAYFLFGRKR